MKPAQSCVLWSGLDPMIRSASLQAAARLLQWILPPPLARADLRQLM